MFKIGLLCDEKWLGKSVDNELIRQVAKNMSLECTEVTWQKIDKQSCREFDEIIIRNTWGYHYDFQRYINTLNLISDNTIMLNHLQDVLDNICKERQLAKLKMLNLDIIPFEIFDKNNFFTLEQKALEGNYEKIVLKPNISASGNDCILLEVGELKDANNKRKLCNYIGKVIFSQNKKIIMQPFVKEICNGEISLVYFFDRYSHSVVRYPGVLYEKKVTSELKELSADLQYFANRIPQILNLNKVLYTRVDIVIKKEGPVIMEIEQNEPDLYFRVLDNNREKIIDFLKVAKSYLDK